MQVQVYDGKNCVPGEYSFFLARIDVIFDLGCIKSYFFLRLNEHVADRDFGGETIEISKLFYHFELHGSGSFILRLDVVGAELLGWSLLGLLKKLDSLDRDYF